MDAKVETRINTSYAMPSWREDLLIGLGQKMSDNRWEVGDQVNQQISENRMRDLKNTEMRVYADVAQLVGKSSSSVRRYAYTAQFFTQHLREQFEPLLYGHFNFTMQFSHNRRYEILTATRLYMDEISGKLPKIDWMEVNFRGTSQLDTALDDIEERAEIDDIIHGPLTEDPWADEEPAVSEPGVSGDGFIVSNVARVLDYLRRQGEKLPVSEETRERWLTVCDAFLSVLAEIRREMAEKRDN